MLSDDMKYRWILTLLFCGLLFPALRAEDEVAQKVPNDQTAQIPKTSPVCVRLPSLNRVDALAKQFAPIIDMMQPGVKPLLEAGISNMMMAQLGLDPAGFNRDAPVYMGLSHEGEKPFFLLTPAAEKGIAGEKDLPQGMKLVVKDGMVHVGDPEALGGPRRDANTKMLNGDFAVHVFISDLVTRYKEDIEGGLAQAKGMAEGGLAQGMVPMAVAVDPFMAAARGAIYGVDSVAYAMTVKEDILETEGLVMTKAESGLRKFLARAGAPRENSLADYLPAEAFMTMDYAASPDWPGEEMMQFAKDTLGQQGGNAIGQMLSMSKPVWGMLTGRNAVALTLQGMMGYNFHSIYELKEGVDSTKLMDKFDIAKLNEAMKELKMPLEYKLEKNVGKHGETQLHKLSMTSEDPQMQMALMMATYYLAAEGNHMFMVMSMNAELEIKDLIDRVRKGEAKAGAHTKAMDRLGRKRNLGLTFNFGALKAMAMMFAMLDPQAGQMMAAIPDEMYMSTALSVHDGDLHWKGDLPLKQIMKLVQDVKAMEGAGDGNAPGNSEFD